MCVEILAPEIDVLVVVEEKRYAMTLEKPCDHFNVGPVLACERKSNFVTGHGPSRLTMIRRNIVSRISAFPQEGHWIKGKHEFFIIRIG